MKAGRFRCLIINQGKCPDNFFSSDYKMSVVQIFDTLILLSGLFRITTISLQALTANDFCLKGLRFFSLPTTTKLLVKMNKFPQ